MMLCSGQNLTATAARPRGPFQTSFIGTQWCLAPEWELQQHLSLSTGHYPRWMVHIMGIESCSLFFGAHNISVQESFIASQNLEQGPVPVQLEGSSSAALQPSLEETSDERFRRSVETFGIANISCWPSKSNRKTWRNGTFSHNEYFTDVMLPQEQTGVWPMGQHSYHQPSLNSTAFSLLRWRKQKHLVNGPSSWLNLHLVIYHTWEGNGGG